MPFRHRSGFGPPPREIISFGGVAGLALAIGICSATALRPAQNLKPLWRVCRVWSLLLGAALFLGGVVRLWAPSFLMEDGPLAHPGHTPDIAPVVMKLFVVAIAAIFMAAGSGGAWRTRQVRLGVLAAVATATIGGVLGLAAGVVALVAFGPPGSRVSLEALPMAVLVVPMLSTFPGTIGALFGRGIGDLPARRLPPSFQYSANSSSG